MLVSSILKLTFSLYVPTTYVGTRDPDSSLAAIAVFVLFFSSRCSYAFRKIPRIVFNPLLLQLSIVDFVLFDYIQITDTDTISKTHASQV
jgi:hypothetical protein